LVIYHHQPGRQARLRRFYGAFLGPGALAFDVGAHVGNRVRAWRSLGCRVVAFEPQGACGVLLDRWFGADPGVTIDRRGLGAVQGRLVLRRPTANPTLATFSAPWIGELAAVPGFASTQWDQEEVADVTTLDAALTAYGTPDFVKIDVEGFEDQVLAGLSVPLRALSVEFVPGALGPALGCLDRLEALGTYEYNLSLGESMRWLWPTWVDASTLRDYLASLGPGDRGGDVYARRLPG
jgi:FkbM family methyltransferase